MPDVYKFSLIFEFTPDTTRGGNLTVGRQGGFSENYWITRPTTANERGKWANLRARLLAGDCAIIGYREAKYTYNGNKMTPQGVTVGTLFRPGGNLITTNSPDDALRILAKCDAANHAWTFFIRSIPDENIVSGQYVPNPDFNASLIDYLADLVAGVDIGQKIQFVGRDPTTPKARVLSYGVVANQLVVNANLALNNGQDFIRFNRVYDAAGAPIKGVFLVVNQVQNPDNTTTYTLQQGPAQVAPRPSGTVRKDAILTSPINAADVRIVGERKVGRPSLAYRGRRTRSR